MDNVKRLETPAQTKRLSHDQIEKYAADYIRFDKSGGFDASVTKLLLMFDGISIGDVIAVMTHAASMLRVRASNVDDAKRRLEADLIHGSGPPEPLPF
jgi:hypothetical protein